jgi:hypothetical protein
METPLREVIVHLVLLADHQRVKATIVLKSGTPAAFGAKLSVDKLR